MYRLMTADSSKSTELAFARAIAQTQEITEVAIKNKLNVNLSDYLSTVYYAMYSHQNMTYKF